MQASKTRTPITITDSLQVIAVIVLKADSKSHILSLGGDELKKNLEQAHNTIRIISKSAAMQEEVNTVEDCRLGSSCTDLCERGKITELTH